MMTTVQALVWSGILTLLMLVVQLTLCTKAWTPPGLMDAFGNREGLPTPSGMAGRADRAARNMIQEFSVDTGGDRPATVGFTGIVPVIGGASLPIRNIGPDLGEHTDQVLSELLGVDSTSGAHR